MIGLTLLQQARLFLEESDAQDTPQWQVLDCMLQYLAQRHADASGPARTPGELRCKVCGGPVFSYTGRCVASCINECRPPTVTLHDLVLTPGERKALPDGRELINHGSATLYVNLRDNTARYDAPPSTAVGDLDLDALQRLCDAATPGPWVYSELLASIGGRDGALVCAMTTSRLDEAGDEQNPQAAADGEFLEAARDALPKLIAKVRDLERRMECDG